PFLTCQVGADNGDIAERLRPPAPTGVVSDDLSALGRERLRAGAADAAGSTGAEHPLPGKSRLHLGDSVRCGARVDDMGGRGHGRVVREAAERRALRLRLASNRPLDQLSLEHAGRGRGGVKVFIVSDMEGVAGIVKWQQTDGTKEKRAFHEGRELYTEEINAAVRGAKSAGAKEIVVMDCHGAGEEWTFNSLIPD